MYLGQCLLPSLSIWRRSKKFGGPAPKKFLKTTPFCLARDAYPGGRRGSCPFLSSSMGEGGPKIALRTEFFPSLQSAEGAFSGIVDCLVLENLPGGKPADSQINIFLLGD